MENGCSMQEFLPFRSAWRARGRCVLCAGFVLLLICRSAWCPAQPPSHFAPSDVEAAYLYNFGKFVRWPSGKEEVSAPFAICTLGDNGFDDTLKSLVANETIDGRSIVSKRLTSASAASGCQIVFIGQAEAPGLERDLVELQKKPILTVSSLPEFLRRGGMIQFILQNNRVRFAVNLPAAEQTGLSLSSELLKVATHVDSKSEREAK
jgi:hypothetical protein